MDGMIKVVRDGPRGWHWISAASFDANKHVLWETEEVLEAREQEAEKAAKLAAKEAEKEAKRAAAEAAKQNQRPQAN